MLRVPSRTVYHSTQPLVVVCLSLIPKYLPTDPEVSQFLDLLDGTLYLHHFTIYPCSVVNKSISVLSDL